MSITRGSPILQSDMNALATLANTKLSPGTPYSFTGLHWLAVLSQIRSDLFGSTLLYNASPTRTPTSSWYCSGPWCVSQGTRCCLYLPTATGVDFPAYENLKFLWATNLSAGPGFQEEALINEVILPGSGLLTNPGNESYSTNRTGLITGTITYLYVADAGQTQVQTESNYTLAGSAATFPYVFTSGLTGTGSCYGQFVFSMTAVSSSASYDYEITCPAASGLNITSTTNWMFTNNSKIFPSVSSGVGIHPTSSISQCSLANVTSADVNLTMNSSTFGPYQTHWLSDTPGVYTANTLPTWGMQVFLDQDLPQYYDQGNTISGYPSGPWSHGSDFVQEPAPNPATTEINTLPQAGGTGNSAFWPVYPSSAFNFQTNFPGPYFWNETLLNSNQDPFHFFQQFPTTLVAGASTGILGSFQLTQSNLHNIKLWATDATQKIFIKLNDIASPTNYTYEATGTFDLITATSGNVVPWQSAFWSWCVQNPNGTGSTFLAQQGVFYPDSNNVYSDNPVFFPAATFGTNQIEPFSYNLAPNLFETPINPWPENTPLDCYLSIPTSGYCIFDLRIRRAPVANVNGIFLAPSSGTADLVVDIGVQQNATFATSGTFSLIQSFTIPAGQAELHTQVFWPVIGGAPIAYQSVGDVNVFASANFQPAIFSNYWPVVTSGQPSPGNHEWSAYFETTVLWQFVPTFGTEYFLPITSDIYNDLTTLLGLL